MKKMMKELHECRTEAQLGALNLTGSSQLSVCFLEDKVDGSVQWLVFNGARWSIKVDAACVETSSTFLKVLGPVLYPQH